jgi:hypothetical protein
MVFWCNDISFFLRYMSTFEVGHLLTAVSECPMLPLKRKETLGSCMSKDCVTTTDLSWVIVMGNISNFINMFHIIQVARWPGFLNCITMQLA